MAIELLIENNAVMYAPAVEDGITWQTERMGSPGILKFSVVKDAVLNIQEGNPVMLKVGGVNVFYGFIFTKKRNKEKVIEITAYDQLRYFKNKDTLSYKNKTASELIRMLINDFQLQAGDIEDTGFKIAIRTEENKTLFDMAQNALDATLQNTKEMYVLYDDYGKLALKNISSMILNLLIDEETGENFDYSSSIDENTYNKVKLTYENEEAGKRDTYITKDTANINRWGVLQYHETLQEGENGQAKADALLELYNKKTRTLSIKNAFGDVRVRAGCMVVVQLNLGDILVNNLMLVEKCKHTFKDSTHFMDLTLRGGEFIA